MLNGLCQTWKNDKLFKEKEYSNNKLKGKKLYYENGTLQSEKVTGKFAKYCDENGKLSFEEIYLDEEVLEKIIKYFTSGIVNPISYYNGNGDEYQSEEFDESEKIIENFRIVDLSPEGAVDSDQI